MLVCCTLQPFCSLHLQLQMSENPYLSGSISTKSSVPGIIVATGMIYKLLTTFDPATPLGYVPYSFRLVTQQKGNQRSIRHVVVGDSQYLDTKERMHVYYILDQCMSSVTSTQAGVLTRFKRLPLKFTLKCICF